MARARHEGRHEPVEPLGSRGGVSIGAVLTGVAVAVGALFVLTAIIGAVGVGLGLTDQTVTPAQIGWGLGIAVVVAQLVSYLWGGYTAGRMARGAGFLNGLLVPVAALVIALLVALIAGALGAAANVPGTFGTIRLPVEQDFLVQVGVPIGILSLLAMFGGAVWGGVLGARWHDRFEASTPVEARRPRAA